MENNKKEAIRYVLSNLWQMPFLITATTSNTSGIFVDVAWLHWLESKIKLYKEYLVNKGTIFGKIIFRRIFN